MVILGDGNISDFPFVCPPSSVISRFPRFPDVILHYLYNGNGNKLQKHFKGRMLTTGLLAEKAAMGNLLAYLLRRWGEVL